MNKNIFLRAVGWIFLFVGILHLTRGLLGWDLILYQYNIPPWLSVIVGLLLLFLSYQGFKKGRL